MRRPSGTRNGIGCDGIEGARVFTDSGRTEVMRFALDLVANDYRDPRDLGKTYGRERLRAEQSNDAEAGLEATPGYLRRYRRALELHAYPVFGNEHIDNIRVAHVDTAASRSGLGGGSRKRFIGGLLSPIFDYAIDREWRERANPCRATSK